MFQWVDTTLDSRLVVEFTRDDGGFHYAVKRSDDGFTLRRSELSYRTIQGVKSGARAATQRQITRWGGRVAIGFM